MHAHKRLLQAVALFLGMMFTLFIVPLSSQAEDRPEIFLQLGHTSSVNTLRISQDNKRLLSASDDRNIKLWDMVSGRLIRSFQDSESVEFVDFLPEEKSFFSVNDKGNVAVWDFDTGERIKEFTVGEIQYASLNSPVSYNGQVLRIIVGLTLYVSDISTGTILQSVKRPESRPISNFLGFSFGLKNILTMDGKRMLSSVRTDPSESIMSAKFNDLMLWDLATGNILAKLSGHRDIIDCMVFSPDEKLAASGSRDQSVRVWDLKKGKEVAAFTGQQKEITSLAFSPDQKYLLSGSYDNTMKLWNIKSKKEIRTFGHDCEVTFVQFSKDGLFAFSGDDKGAVHLWDIKTGKEVKTLKSYAAYASAMDMTKDGRHLLTGFSNGELRLWDAVTGTMQKKFPAHNNRISSVQFMPDGKSAVSAAYDKTLKLWDMNGRMLQGSFPGNIGEAYYKAVMSPDGMYALIASSGKEVKLWHVKSGKQINTFNFPDAIASIGFTADSRHVIIAYAQKYDKIITVMTFDGKEVKHYEDVKFSTYSKDGRYFLAKGFKETTGREAALFTSDAKPEQKNLQRLNNQRTLVDIAGGEVLGRFGQGGPVVHLSACKDKDLLLVKYYADTQIALWNIRTGREVRRFPSKFGYLSPDGKKVIALAGSTLQAFDTATGSLLTAFSGNAGAEICSFSLSAKGGYAVTGDIADGIAFWDVSSGRLIKTIDTKAGTYGKNAILAVAFSPDNRYAASMAKFGKTQIWSLREGNKVSEFDIDYTPAYYDEIESGDYVNFGDGILAFSPDSRYLACGSKLWEVSSGRKIRDFQTPFGPGPWVAFSYDGAYLLSRNAMWDVSTGRRVKAFKSIESAGRSIFSPNGKRIYARDDDGAFYVVDSDTGKLIGRFADFISPSFFDVSSDKKMMLVAQNEFNNVTVCDLPSGKIQSSIQVNQKNSGVLISTDRRKAVLSGISVKQIDLGTGKEIAQFINFIDGEWIVITKEGYYNASANGDKYLNVRIGENVYGIENYREVFFRPDLVQVALSGGSLKNFRNIADIQLPPTVVFIDPPTSVNKDDVKLTLSITDNGGGIGDIRFYLNGSAVVMENTRAIKLKAKPGQPVIRTYILKLRNGSNAITAVAFNSDNSMQSNPAELDITASYKAPEKPSLFALVIGINEFKNPKLTLNYPIADASLFAETLQQVSARLFSKITIRKLTEVATTTNQAIIREINAFHALRPDDVFVLYIASHGTVDDGEYFLITSNVGSTRTEKLKTDAISQQMLKESIANIPATKKLIIIDTCSAGALGEAIQTSVMTRGMSEDTALKILSRSMGSTILSASTSVQEALEGYNGHGLFTYVLTEGLKGKADKGKTGYVKTTELADYVDDEVPAIAEKVFKRPQYPTISISGQAFPIGKVD